jgi:hypothetical protein
VTVVLVLPDLDIWLKAFSRRQPDPLIVHEFGRRVSDRRVLLLGWVRVSLLARVRDERQAARLRWLLDGFPDPRISVDDQVRAAAILRMLAASGSALSMWSALAWAVAERLQARIWSADQRWQALAAHGCPWSA